MNVMNIGMVLILAAGTALPALAEGNAAAVPPQNKSGNVCLQRDMIDGWGYRDDKKIVVNDRFGKKYLLSLAGWCQDFDVSLGISFHSPGHAQYMCLDRGDFVVPHGGGAMPAPGARCTITKIEPYTPAMEAAYKDAKAKAKADRDAAHADK